MEQEAADVVATLPNTVTITDLQTYAVVQERIAESMDWLNRSRASLQEFDREDSLFSLAYAIERRTSALAWSEFFGQEGAELFCAGIRRGL